MSNCTKETEVWKDITGYEGYYQVSSFGNVRSLDRDSVRTGVGKVRLRGKMLKFTDNKGYLIVGLSKNNKSKKFIVSRLVANEFVPIKCGKNEVNHIDENKHNNHFSNLEWVTPKENANHGTRLQKVMGNLQLTSEKQKTPVVMIDKETDEMVERFDSINDAFRWLGVVANGSISNVCNGKNKTAYGYKWRYSN